MTIQTWRRTTRLWAFMIMVGLGLSVGSPGEQADPGRSYETVVEPFEVPGPTGNRIYGQLRRPVANLGSGQRFPAVILVPGGINPGRMEVFGRDARMLAEAGLIVVCFNAEGRMDSISNDDLRSEGDEDYNGFRHQDGLAAVIRFIADLDSVDSYNIGVKSQSYGITMAAGCLGRYPELPVRYLIEGEGPSDSFVTCHGPRFLAGDLQKPTTVETLFGRLPIWQDDSPENLAWWEEREAVRFIGGFRGQYLRLQATWDHAQPPDTLADMALYHHPEGWPGDGPAWWHNKHAADMITAAVVGGVPWVRVNLDPQRNPVNAVYDAGAPPAFLPGRLADQPWAVRAILDRAGVTN